MEFKVRLKVMQYDTYLVEAASEQEAIVLMREGYGTLVDEQVGYDEVVGVTPA